MIGSPTSQLDGRKRARFDTLRAIAGQCVQTCVLLVIATTPLENSKNRELKALRAVVDATPATCGPLGKQCCSKCSGRGGSSWRSRSNCSEPRVRVKSKRAKVGAVCIRCGRRRSRRTWTARLDTLGRSSAVSARRSAALWNMPCSRALAGLLAGRPTYPIRRA